MACSMKKIIFVAGARPNFMKIAPLLRALKHSAAVRPVIVHTGQHYDNNMSTSFFTDLGIDLPHYNLEVGSGTHAEQTAAIMTRFEKVCLAEKPQCVVVVGDVNSTIAAGLVAKKLGICLAHVEAGLRSRDMTMPEEINRMATDSITDLFFTTEPEAKRNLLSEGHPAGHIYYVGNVMVDNLLFQLNKCKRKPLSGTAASLKKRLPARYLCLTLHRPSNVDSRETLTSLVTVLSAAAEKTPIVFPCHPRTRAKIDEFGLSGKFSSVWKSDKKLTGGICIIDPLGYNDFLYLWKDAAAVVTDSGGLQEETTALNIPCITIRNNTERPITVSTGSNVLAGTDPGRIASLIEKVMSGTWKKSSVPKLWDGKASERIAAVLAAMAS
jgi:UDP-N-acetylglucosamine 2-epimerase (non-hydrolysing)